MDFEKSYKKYKPLLSTNSLNSKLFLSSKTTHRLAKDTCKEFVIYINGQDEKLKELKSILSIPLTYKNKLLTF
jgi:hypothetical protein